MESLNKTKEALEFLSGVASSAEYVEKQSTLLADEARQLCEQGDWQQRGVRATFIRGGIGSRQEWPHIYKGTQFVPVPETSVSVAVREEPGNDESGNVLVNLLVLESNQTEDDAVALVTFYPGGEIVINGRQRADDVGSLESIRHLLWLVGVGNRHDSQDS